MHYINVREYKALLYPKDRYFCSDCGKPQRTEDDDLDDILAKSDYCNCRLRGLDSD